MGLKINSSIAKVINSNKFIMGPEVSTLEEKLSNYLNVDFSISCANGTDALSLALIALDFKERQCNSSKFYIYINCRICSNFRY